MYALAALLSLVATAAFVRAFAYDATDAAPASPRRWAIVFAVALAALLYSHNWGLFLTAGCGLAWLGLLASTPRERRRDMLVTGLVAFGGAALLYVPWLPSMAYQVAHTGAPWSAQPDIQEVLAVPGRLLGDVGQVALLLSAGAGLVALLGREAGASAVPANAKARTKVAAASSASSAASAYMRVSCA